MNKVRCGIDPGKMGAIAFIHDSGEVETHVMPCIGPAGKKEYDLQGIRKLLTQYQGYDLHIVIENVHSIFGASAHSNFTFGVGVGYVQMAAAMAQIPFTLIQPKAWQDLCFVGVGAIEKSGSKAKGRGRYDTKAMALIAANRLYPKVNLLATARSSVPHQGIVDALMLAHYGKQKL